MFVNAIPVPVHPSEEFKGIKVTESDKGIEVREGVDYVVFLGEVVVADDLVSFAFEKSSQTIHVKVDQVAW
jgi:hypothetical protein